MGAKARIPGMSEDWARSILRGYGRDDPDDLAPLIETVIETEKQAVGLVGGKAPAISLIFKGRDEVRTFGEEFGPTGPSLKDKFEFEAYMAYRTSGWTPAASRDHAKSFVDGMIAFARKLYARCLGGGKGFKRYKNANRGPCH